jgi:3-deoxy-D-manno-octulosonic-acid transferase
MPYLLDLVYAFLLLLAAPVLAWQAVFRGKRRCGLAAKLLGRVPRREGDAHCVWLHAVSVGEVNLLAPLLAELAELAHRRPQWQCVVSTTTRAGYDLARAKYGHLAVFYCPLDFSWAVRATLRRVRPSLLVLAELELWPNLVRAAREHGARVAVVNARLGERSHRGWCRARWLARRVFADIDLIAAQDEASAERFRDLGAPSPRVHVTGSVKFDGARTDRDNPATQELVRLAGIAPEDIVLLAGSTQAPEESLALATFQELSAEFPRLRLILVPRHPERFDEVARLLKQGGLPWHRRTELDSNATSSLPARILLVDTVGELAAWWGAAHVAFVGGSLGNDRGGQNMIEPAAYGAAVCFGPGTRNFRDIVAALVAREAAVVVRDGRELSAFVRRCLLDRPFAEGLGRRAQQLVREQQGATRHTIELLLPLLEDAATTRQAA